MGSATGGGGDGGDASPQPKSWGDIMSYIPRNHDGSEVTLMITALNRPLHFNACLFLAGPTARLFHHFDSFELKTSMQVFLYLL